MKDIGTVRRFITMVRKPFTALDFIESTGLAQRRAVRALNLAASLAILNYLGGKGEERVYVSIPPKSPKYWDFTPDRAKLAMVQGLLKKNRYQHHSELVSASGMGVRTLQRYLEMLAYLGCAKERMRGKVSREYLRVDKAIPVVVPPYFRTFSSSWKGTMNESVKWMAAKNSEMAKDMEPPSTPREITGG